MGYILFFLRKFNNETTSNVVNIAYKRMNEIKNCTAYSLINNTIYAIATEYINSFKPINIRNLEINFFDPNLLALISNEWNKIVTIKNKSTKYGYNGKL